MSYVYILNIANQFTKLSLVYCHHKWF